MNRANLICAGLHRGYVACELYDFATSILRDDEKRGQLKVVAALDRNVFCVRAVRSGALMGLGGCIVSVNLLSRQRSKRMAPA